MNVIKIAPESAIKFMAYEQVDSPGSPRPPGGPFALPFPLTLGLARPRLSRGGRLILPLPAAWCEPPAAFL